LVLIVGLGLGLGGSIFGFWNYVVIFLFSIISYKELNTSTIWFFFSCYKIQKIKVEFYTNYE